MPFPQRVQAALAETNISALSGVLAVDGRECAGAKFHSPTPLILNEVPVAGAVVLLCGTCWRNLDVLRHLLVQNGGDLPWTVRREFGNLIRALAMREWQTNDEDEDDSA